MHEWSVNSSILRILVIIATPYIATPYIANTFNPI